MFDTGSWMRYSASTLFRNAVFTLSCCAFLVPKSGICQSPEGKLPSRTADHYGLKYKEVQRAILVFKKGSHDGAREILVDAKLKHSELPPVDVMMARLYLSAGEMKKAENALERVVIEVPDDPEGFVLLGDLALRADRPAFAELAYDRASLILNHYDAIAERKQNLQVRVLAGLASLAESRGHYQQAASLLSSWIEFDPESRLAHGSLGRMNFHMENYDGARAAFQRLFDLSPTSPPVEIAMGRLFSESAMYDEAYQEMTTAAKRYPNDTRVLLTVGEWAVNNGLLDLAQKSVSEAMGIDKQSLEGNVLSARLARYSGDYETAESRLSELMPLHPNSILLTDEYARTLATSGDPQKRKAAILHAERNYRVLRKRKSSMMLQSIITYAWALFNNGETDKAEAVVQSLPNGSSISNENGYYVACIYAGREKTGVAIAMLESLLTEDRPFPSRLEAKNLLAKLTTK